MDEWEPVARTYCPLKAGSIDGTDTVPHDKAVYRAMNSKYKPNRNVIGDPENTVFVGRLDLNTDEETIENFFCKYGKVKSLRLVRDIVTGFSKGYAFIEYYDRDTAYRTQKYLDKTVLDERELYVDFECERTLTGWVPRRLGGGLCGKKESGQLRFGGKNRPFRKPFNIENVVVPEGKTFQERLKASERGNNDRRERVRDSDWPRRDRYSDRDDREQSRTRDHYKMPRDRDRDREHHSDHRSRSRNRSRSKSYERKMRK